MPDSGSPTPGREVNQLEVVSRWAEDLAHEIKNPFHSMFINLELVKRRAGDPEGLEERAAVVESELHRVHDLIDAVLRLVRPWPDRAATDVDATLSALLPAVRARATLHRLDYEHAPGGATAAIPPADLLLVLLNLVDNALDALPKGGRLRTLCTHDDEVVRLHVADDGPGLDGLEGDPFEPGVTSREGRSGLGLPVSRRLVERAGGTLVVEPDEDGPGLRATAAIPRADRPG